MRYVIDIADSDEFNIVDGDAFFVREDGMLVVTDDDQFWLAAWAPGKWARIMPESRGEGDDEDDGAGLGAELKDAIYAVSPTETPVFEAASK